MNANAGSTIITTLEATWQLIRSAHPDLPNAVIVTGTGRKTQGWNMGHWASGAWSDALGERVGEVFIAGEFLEMGAEETLNTMLHEAAHALGSARGIVNVNKNGATHNKRYKVLAEELGLSCKKNGNYHGYNDTELTEETLVTYADEIARLGEVLKLYRPAVEREKKGKDRNNLKLECPCGRVVRASKKTVEGGDILCGVCMGPFLDEDDERREW